MVLLNKNPPSTKLIAYGYIIRPREGISAGISLIIASIIVNLGNSKITLAQFLSLFMFGIVFTSLIMVHNDLMDQHIDQINAPYRALPSGVISRKDAWNFTFILLFLYISSLILVGSLFNSVVKCTICSLFLIILGIVYNLYIKKLGVLGNAIVAALVAFVYIFPDLLINNHLTAFPLIIALAAFFVNFGREMIKDLTDTEGDAKYGVKTLGVLLGPKIVVGMASMLIILGLLTVCSILYIPSLRTHFYLFNQILLLVLIIGMIYLLKRLWDSQEIENIYWVKKRIFYFMQLIVLPFFLQSIFNYSR